MQRPERIASPVNRTPSFEIAIHTSPPLSPCDYPTSSPPPPPPPHGALSPARSRGNVHETILRETREYMIHTSRPAHQPLTSQTIVAPIAEPESTSSLRTESPEVFPKKEQTTTVIDDHFDEEVAETAIDDVENSSQILQVENLQTVAAAVSTQSLEEAPQERPIVFPITPFYRRKGSKFCKCSIWLGILCSIFFLLFLGFLIAWIVTANQFKLIGNKLNICETRQCIDMAFRMSSSVDENIEPCDNFYQYSCKKFNANGNSPESFISQLRESSDKSINALLSSSQDSKTLPNSENLARSLFSQCMNAIQRSTNSPNDLLNFIKNFPCGPILKECTSFHADTYSWERHSGMLDWYAGDNNLILYSRDVHPQDRSKIILQITPPNLLPLLNPVIRNLLTLTQQSSSEFDPLLSLSIRQNILTPLIRDEFLQDPRHLQKELDEIAALFVDLYRATWQSSNITPNTTYMTFGEMFKSMPQLYLKEFLDAQLSSVYKWKEEDMLSIQDFDYFARLVDIMAKTSRKTVANYLVIITALNLDQYSYSPREQFGWRECVEQLSNLELVQKMYISSKNINREKTQDFLQNLKTNFISTHRSTPLQYLSEINRLAFYVGYPDRLLSEELIWKPVSQISINNSDYFDSIIKVSKAERDFKMQQIGTYLDNDDTTQYPITKPDMLYNPHIGGIIIPLAFLEAPIYIPGDDVPMYGMYSSIGITVLQMISRIFWQGLDKSAQLQCFDNVFRGLLNSSRQRAANIEPQLLATIDLADAFKTTLYAYTKWQSDNNIHNEKSLPSFDNHDSMRTLMISFSTLFCNGEGSEAGSDYEAMINSVVQTSRMFSIHFNCSNSTRLFNRKTCI
ncbi:unnamed protein product [Caenorhabditis angaria]|uniref:Peptidase M13 N-terminal domain-containing protein n=1 Tax=Caenorhabditis angaria TaxID=860376 RepID=A0A9P1ITG9_9PELO|nr:unnamed protein product [Caenorhabditis angaria]